MTEPSKVIHVRNVGHEISEVCFCHSLFSMWIPPHPYYMFWNLILVSLACQKLYDCQNLLIQLNSRSPRSIEWIDMYDSQCMLICLLMVITFINLLVFPFYFSLAFVFEQLITSISLPNWCCGSYKVKILNSRVEVMACIIGESLKARQINFDSFKEAHFI